MDKLITTLSRTDARLVLLVMLLLIGFVTFEGYYLLLRKPYAEHKKTSEMQATLAATIAQIKTENNELGKVALEAKQLSEKLKDALPFSATDDKITASLISALDRSATAHGISLSGVKPGERKIVSNFEEITFEVNLRGRYLPLCQWMLNFEKTLGKSAAIREFDMQSGEEGKQVSLTLKIALYRPLLDTEAAK